MTAIWKHIVLLVIASLLAAPSALAQNCDDSGESVAIESIRQQREVFNQAIEQGDASLIPAVLHEDVILISGSDSDVYEGRNTQVDMWRNDFTDPGRAIYVRTTLCIRVSPTFPIALEQGAWRGVRISSASDTAAGRYSAKWRKVDDAWLLESEVFMTEECTGDFCPE